MTTRASWVAEFDRGGGFGLARYNLTQVNFKFVATERGWDLVRESDRPTAFAPAPAPAPSGEYASFVGR